MEGLGVEVAGHYRGVFDQLGLKDLHGVFDCFLHVFPFQDFEDFACVDPAGQGLNPRYSLAFPP
ncbi:hypothetical protein D1872_349550 [compost metagenome]